MNTKFEKPVFLIRSYRKSELVSKYMPHYSYKVGHKKFNEYLRTSSKLWEELQATGLDVNTRCYTSQQVKLIVKHLGEPEEQMHF